VESQTVREAAEDLAALDHDFFLFHDSDTGRDAVLHRRDDGRLGLIAARDASPVADGEGVLLEPSRYTEPTDLAVARGEMDELDHRFLFFVNATTGRGNVIYLRYDGHYGLIEPSAAPAP